MIAPHLGLELVYYGALEPEFVTGAKNGLFPSSVVFGPAAGTLVSSAGAEGEATLEGRMTFEGASHIELLSAF